MNPITTIIGKYKTYRLTEEDKKRMAKVKVIGEYGDAYAMPAHEMCIMQVVSMVTVEAERVFPKFSADGAYPDPLPDAYSDGPVCVSLRICDYMIALNDNGTNTNRGRKRLLSVVEDIINTAPVIERGMVEMTYDENEAYQEAEDRREEILERISPTDPKVSLKAKLELVREAAAVYRTDRPVPEPPEAA